MKRDWMQTGRRPSGICGAALFIASHIHGRLRAHQQPHLPALHCRKLALAAAACTIASLAGCDKAWSVLTLRTLHIGEGTLSKRVDEFSGTSVGLVTLVMSLVHFLKAVIVRLCKARPVSLQGTLSQIGTSWAWCTSRKGDAEQARGRV